MSLTVRALLLVQRFIGLAVGLFFAAFVLARLIWVIVRKPQKLFNRKDRTKSPACLSDPALGTHGYVSLSEVRLHYVAAGEEGKPLMLLLHGFPEFWYSWRYQIREFQKDYRVVAVDLRGYADSDKPKGVSNYRMSKMVEDVRQLIPALGYKSCTLVGHDWGGAISFSFAAMHPDAVERLVVMNCPHPAAFQPYLCSHLAQFKKSWYMFLFQVPYLPEFYLSLNDFAAVRAIFKGQGGVRNGRISQEDIEAYLYAVSKKGGLTGPINYIRAMLSFGMSGRRELGSVQAPTLLIWGCQDVALEKGLAQASCKYLKEVQVRYLEEASHWVQMDMPDEVNRIMRGWLKEHRS